MDACRAERLAALPSKAESGCASSCSDDNGCSARSSCRNGEVDDCVTRTRAMACADQSNSRAARYPGTCSTCFL